MTRWRSETTSLIIRLAYCASRKNGPNFRFSRPTFIRKAPASVYLSRGPSLSADLKIAVLGLTTDDTAKIGNPEFFTDIEFRKPADEAKLVIQELNMGEKPDIIVATTHMGHYDNGNHGSNALAMSKWRAAFQQVRWR